MHLRRTPYTVNISTHPCPSPWHDAAKALPSSRLRGQGSSKRYVRGGRVPMMAGTNAHIVSTLYDDAGGS